MLAEDISYFGILVKPIITEKSNILGANNVITFEVIKSANKHQISSAIELVFSVKVKKVHTMQIKSTTRFFKRKRGVTKSWKKAYVYLEEGYKVDMYGDS